jgi:hypothetical protein
LRGRLNFGRFPFRYESICFAASSRTLEDPTEFAFLQSSTIVIFSSSAVIVMKPKGEGYDRLEITDSLMPQLLSVFDSGKVIFGDVERLNPKTHWVLGY